MKEDKKQVTIHLRRKRHPAITIVNQLSFWLIWGGMFWVNKTFLDNSIPHWAIVVVLIMVIIGIVASLNDNKFETPEEAKKFIDEFFS
jgi:Zn-dependent membrane protease YugP